MLSYSERFFLNVNVIMLLLWWKSISGFPDPSVRIRAITVTLVHNALWIWQHPVPHPPSFHIRFSGLAPEEDFWAPKQGKLFYALGAFVYEVSSFIWMSLSLFAFPPPPHCPKSARQRPAYPSGISFRPLLQLLLGVLSPPSPR